MNQDSKDCQNFTDWMSMNKTDKQSYDDDLYRKWLLWVCFFVIPALIYLLLLATSAHAQTIGIGGQDASGQMKDVQTLITTMQNIGFKWVAPLIGGGLAIFGIFQIATRHLGTGLLALGGGGALFAIERIATSLSHIAGN